MKCKTCKSPCTWAGKEESEHGKCLVGYTPITNADRIRAMTDEKLAKQIAEWNQGDCPTIGDCPETQNSFECEPWRCWLSWLRQETEEGEWLTEEDFEEWVEKMKHLTGENE